MNKKIIILGAAESGIGAAILAKQQGFDVFVSDGGDIKEHYKNDLIKYDIDFEENKHSEEIIFSANEIIKSPGIPEKNELIKKIRAKKISIISEIEFAYRYKGNSKVIAITGSNGKTTTTTMVYHICTVANLNSAVCGNIGHSFAKQIALEPKEYYVIEVSSFQLDDIVTFKPDIAILTNITEDHLDRYEYKVENYIKSKFNITKNLNQNDAFIYCQDDATTMQYLPMYPNNSINYPITMNKETNPGAFIKNGIMTIARGTEVMEMNVSDFTVKGKHNQYNTMAAAMAASLIGIRKEKIRDAINTFENIEHRLEPVAYVRGVEYINDSKATNINSTWYALESMTKPTILILGGVDKGNDYTILQELVDEKVKAIICLGLDNRKIHEAFGNTVSLIVNTQSAEEAVKAAYHFAAVGDAVLLSPACASFDLFKNFEDRGNQFKIAVREL
jgi:UDP-N-acetylmuramoylalanine--D-glutamate ligase